jgi:hypothetical protein
MERVVKIITETLFFTSIGIGVMMCDLDQHSGNAPPVISDSGQNVDTMDPETSAPDINPNAPQLATSR